MDETLKVKVVETVKSIMGIDILKMSSEKYFNTISEWDSFNNLMLISKFQDDFNIEFTAVEIENTKRIKDLFDLMDKKLNHKNK